MLVHQDERVDLDAESPGQLLESPEDRAAIPVGQEGRFPPVTVMDHVIPPARNNDAQRTSHEATVPELQ